VQAAVDAAQKLRGTLEEAYGEAKKAAVDAANPQASDTIRAKAKDADEKVTRPEQDQGGDKAVDTVISASQKTVSIPNTGDLLSPMLEDLVKMATERVTAVIDPNARSLLSQGFKFIRSFLDPIAQSVISALAGIPSWARAGGARAGGLQPGDVGARRCGRRRADRPRRAAARQGLALGDLAGVQGGRHKVLQLAAGMCHA